MSLLDELRMTARYARALPRFLRHPLSPEDCRRLVKEQLAARTANILSMFDRGVFQNPQSPYRTLLDWAGIGRNDIAALTREHGVEGALARLLESGVVVKLSEFKGRRPIERGGRVLPVAAEQFDNPLVRPQFEGRSGGSRGPSRRLLLDLDLLTLDAANHHIFLESRGLLNRPFAVWRPVPPDNSGIKKILMQARLGRIVDQWFSQSRQAPGRHALFTAQTLLFCRWFARRQSPPLHVPISEAAVVARWLAQVKRNGPPALLDTLAGCAVRVCKAAGAEGLDISGTMFRSGGEPLTAAKALIVEQAGCTIMCHYSMSELGPVAMACADPAAVDDVHMLQSKVAVVQSSTGALHFTSLDPHCPKLMLNVETGDTAVLEHRVCRCPFGDVGYHLHASRIRSYEKLTSEGIQFLGDELITLLEVVLPASFGGSPSDYQLVEEEQDGFTRVALVVSPRVGPVEEERMVRAALEFLSVHSRGHRLMADFWSQANALRVVRREPHATAAGKILPLHILS